MFEINLNVLLTLFWLGISCGVAVPGLWLLTDGQTSVPLINFILQRFYLFGKLKNANQGKPNVFGDVPKSFFLHFYILGLLVNIPVCLLYRSAWLLFCLFIGHMTRRLYECLFVHRYGPNSTMSFIHYLIGIVHYLGVGLTIVVDDRDGHANCSILTRCFALLLFLGASSMQNGVHRALAKNRRLEDQTYPIPTGHWAFDFFSCPNYIAEILIYVSFYLLSHRTLGFLSLTVWVVINQCLSSLLTHRWYRQYYKDAYPSTRRALIPCVW